MYTKLVRWLGKTSNHGASTCQKSRQNQRLEVGRRRCICCTWRLPSCVSELWFGAFEEVKDGQKGLKERDITCTYRDIVYIHRHIHRHIHTYRHIQTHTHIYRYICMYVIFKCAKIRVPEKWMINTAKSRSKASFGYLCYQILHSTEDDDQEINQK